MCLFDPTSLSCAHSLCIQVAMQHTVSLGAILTVQGSLLEELVSQSQVILGLLERLKKATESMTARRWKVEPWRRNGGRDERYALVLDSLPKTPVLRDYSFSVGGFSATLDGHPTSSLSGVFLRLCLYTADLHPRLLTHNITGTAHTGKQILKDSTHAIIGPDGHFIFPKVVINEVSSHYLEGEFTLVVTADSPQVKPAICRHFVVKVRKKHRPRKEHKSET